jgi:hypothetical protein
LAERVRRWQSSQPGFARLLVVAASVSWVRLLARMSGTEAAMATARMARADGQGRHWARILSTVLLGLATLELIRARPHYRGGYLAHFDIGGHMYSVIHSPVGAVVFGLIVPVLLWLIGLTVVWLLWRPGLQRVLQAAQHPRHREERAGVNHRWPGGLCSNPQ